MRRLTRAQSILALLAIMSVLMVPAGVLAAAPLLQSGNLLENPDFNGSSGTECPAWENDGDIKVAEGWVPWWDDSGDEAYIARASFYCEANDQAFIKDGPTSQFMRHEWTTGVAGIMQTVGGIPENSRVRFSIWGKSYSCHDDGSVCTTALAGYMGMQIGIDPNGGTNFYDAAVEFTPGTSSPEWQEFVIEADVPGGGTPVTVFAMFYPDYPLQRNQVWWDTASLTVIGDAQGDTGNPNSPPPPADAKFVTPVPPGPDGSVVHTVEKGDTLAAIAVAYSKDCCPDITIPVIKELNNLSSDIIYVGQKLTIREATGAPPPPEETPVPEDNTDEEPVVEEETPEPEVTEEPAPANVPQICMTIFEDVNGNTTKDPDEFLLAGASLNLRNDATGFSDSYVTDGATEPHCFTQLAPGEYVAEAVPPAGYAMTSVNPYSILVDQSTDLVVPFAAQMSNEPVDTGGEDGTNGKSGGASGNIGRILAALGGLAVLAIAGGLAAYFFVFRRSS